jgi:anti-sigma B factor antagonist
MDGFGVSRHELAGGVVRLAVAGELDLAVSEELATAQLREIETAGVTGLLIDLQQVTFLDSTGVSALVAGLSEARRRGIAFTVANAHDIVRAVLEVTGVLGPLTDPDQARSVADLRPDARG